MPNLANISSFGGGQTLNIKSLDCVDVAANTIACDSIVIDGIDSFATLINKTYYIEDQGSASSNTTHFDSGSSIVVDNSITAGGYIYANGGIDCDTVGDKTIRFNPAAPVTMGNLNVTSVSGVLNPSGPIYVSEINSNNDYDIQMGYGTLTINEVDTAVGINNTFPSEALDVDGNIKATGTVYASNIDISSTSYLRADLSQTYGSIYTEGFVYTRALIPQNINGDADHCSFSIGGDYNRLFIDARTTAPTSINSQIIFRCSDSGTTKDALYLNGSQVVTVPGTLSVTGASSFTGNVTCGSNILKVNTSTGKVGVGKDPNTSYLLDVNGSCNIGTNLNVVGAITGSSSMSISSPLFTVDPVNNSVGVRTATPSATYALDVVGTTRTHTEDLQYPGSITGTNSFTSFKVTAPNMAATGTEHAMIMGQDNTNYNSGKFGFTYNGSGSTTNTMGIGMTGVSPYHIVLKGTPDTTINTPLTVTGKITGNNWIYFSPTTMAGAASYQLASSDIPSTATEVVVLIQQISTATNNWRPLIRVGPSSGVLSAGYNGTTQGINPTTLLSHTTGADLWYLSGGIAANSTIYGKLVFTRWDTGTWWHYSGQFGSIGVNSACISGFITVTGGFQRVQLITGVGVFNTGYASLMYN
jgi:hypothetical protein